MKDETRFDLFLVLLGAAALLLAFFAPSAFRFTLLAFLLAYLVNPLVGLLQRRWKVPRALSTGVMVLLAAALVAGALGMAVPYLAHQVQALVTALPDLAQQGVERLKALGILRVDVPLDTVSDLLGVLREQAAGKEASVAQTAAGYLLRATSGVVGAVMAVLSLFIVPVLFFFITQDLGRIREGFLAMAPPSRRAGAEGYLAMVDRILGGFVRGQATVALILAAVYALGLTLAGLRFGPVIGILTGLLVVIPYAGFALGMATAALVLLVDFSGWGQVAAVAATFAAGQLLETYVLTPRITGDRVGLTPLESLLSVLVFAELGGFLGLLLAVPAGGLVKQTLLLAFGPRRV